MDQDTNSITHAKFRMWLRPDGIVQIVWFPHTLVALADANAAVEGLAEIGGGKPRALLVDMRDTGAQDRATRAAWTSRSDLQLATALIVGTPLSRVVGNLFINMSRPRIPTRLFHNEAAAVRWLLKFVH